MNPHEHEAIVEELEPADGAPTVHIGLRYEDGRVEHAELRADLVPDGLAVGDAVRVTKAALYRRWTVRRMEG